VEYEGKLLSKTKLAARHGKKEKWKESIKAHLRIKDVT
jgi:hypothetical protein